MYLVFFFTIFSSFIFIVHPFTYTVNTHIINKEYFIKIKEKDEIYKFIELKLNYLKKC